MNVVKKTDGVKLHEEPYDWRREEKRRQTAGIVIVIKKE